MKINRSYQFAAVLILTAALLAACHSGPNSMTQYANDTDAKERLTLKTTNTVKTRLISTFHGVSMGSYSLASDDSVVAQGTFTRDGKSFEFKASDGTSLFTKLNSDGTFEYLNRTWKPSTDLRLREPDLKGLGLTRVLAPTVKAAAADDTSR
jgi:hypothetical protein